MFITTLTPRFGDIDGLGHVNNNVLGIWFETARNPIFRIFCPELDLSHEKWRLIMVRTEYDFLGEMFYGEDVEIRSYIENIGNTSFTIGHQAWQFGKIRTKGKAVIVHYDFVNKCTLPIDGKIREQLSKHLFPEDSEQ